MADKIQRLWGLLTVAVVMVFGYMMIGGYTHNWGSSVEAVLWIYIAQYAYKGKLLIIQQLIKYVIYLSVFLIFLFVIFEGSDSELFFKWGGKIDFIGGALATIAPKALLYLYCKSQLKAFPNEPLSSRQEQESSSQEGRPNTVSSFVTPMDSGSPSMVRTNTALSKVCVIPVPSRDETPVNDGLLRPHSTVNSADALVDVRKQILSQSNNKVSSSSINTDESTEEGYWAEAMAELEGNQRRPGVWAKAFSEADGDVAKANAAYMKARVEQMHDLVQAEAAKLVSQQRDEAAKTKALALAKQQGIDEVVNQFLRSGTISEANLRVLIYQQDISKTILMLDKVRGNTLLHICAAIGMLDEVRTLLAAGASPNESNNNGLRPYNMTKDVEIRRLLDERLKYLATKK